MKIVIGLAILGIVVMSVGIGFAFIRGDFLQEGSRLLSMPWGIVSMIDLYTGFILFSGWIIFREKSLLPSIIWIFFMMTLGFFTASVYVLIAALGSKGSWPTFWMGKRAELR